MENLLQQHTPVSLASPTLRQFIWGILSGKASGFQEPHIHECVKYDMLFHDRAVVELWLLYDHDLLKTMCICHVMTLELLLIRIIVLHATVQQFIFSNET